LIFFFNTIKITQCALGLFLQTFHATAFNTILIMNSNSLQINNIVQILKWQSICAPYSGNRI